MIAGVTFRANSAKSAMRNFTRGCSLCSRLQCRHGTLEQAEHFGQDRIASCLPFLQQVRLRDEVLIPLDPKQQQPIRDVLPAKVRRPAR